jgi:hypothetical protein
VRQSKERKDSGGNVVREEDPGVGGGRHPAGGTEVGNFFVRREDEGRVVFVATPADGAAGEGGVWSARVELPREWDAAEAGGMALAILPHENEGHPLADLGEP